MTALSLKHSGDQNIDMLHGPLLVKILLFALPLAASSVMQQLFNSVDVAVVGHFVSSSALAAVGSNAPVISLLINLFIGISMGANAIISNHIGQRSDKNIHNAVNTVAQVALLSGIFLLFVGVAIARPILTMMDTPAEVLDQAVLYLRLYFLGMPFFMIFNFGSAILRSKGDTRRPLYILTIAGVVNVLLNLLFVICFKMGVSGVATATGISNLVSAIFIVRLLQKEEEPLRLHIKEMGITWDELKRMLRIGVPAGVQGMVFSLSNVVVQTSINSFGSDAIAGSAAAVNFEFYCYFVVAAFNGAAISFAGQNYGAGNIERVKRVFWLCLGMGAISCALLNWLFALWGNFFLNFFSSEPSVHRFGLTRMHYVLIFQSVACSYEIAGSVMRGMGKSVLPALLTVFGTCLLRVIWVFVVFPIGQSFEILMVVYPLSWTLTGIMMVWAYAVAIKKSRRIVAS